MSSVSEGSQEKGQAHADDVQVQAVVVLDCDLRQISPQGADEEASSTNQNLSEPRREIGCIQSMLHMGYQLKMEVYSLYFAMQNKECGLAARTLIVTILIYALSPLDFMPELAPLLALLVDILVLPLLLWCTLKLVPEHVMDHARRTAYSRVLTLRQDWHLALFVYLLWLINIAVGVHIVCKHMSHDSYAFKHKEELMIKAALITSVVFGMVAAWRLYVESPGPHKHIPVQDIRPRQEEEQAATEHEQRQPLLQDADHDSV